jgi:hypothetical protein
MTNIIDARKRAEEMNDDSDFAVGVIAGMEDEVTPKRKAKSTPKTTKKTEESVADMTTTTIEKTNVIVNEEMLQGTVSLKVKKDYGTLVELVASKNENVIVQEFDGYYQVNAKQIRITRQDVEGLFGKINDGRWRMLLMNRDGEVSEFNNHILILGIVQSEVEEAKETAQINTRIDSKSKEEMDKIRGLLDMTQAQFLEVAIKEYADKVRSEMIL